MKQGSDGANSWGVPERKIKALKNVNTGMLCQSFTYGDYAMHIPNNADYTVTPTKGQMLLVPGSGCLNISTDDPQNRPVRQPRRARSGGHDVPRVLTVRQKNGKIVQTQR